MYNSLPREKAPLQQEISSQEEDMEISPSRADQDKGYINDEVFPHDEEEEKEELERASSAITTGGYPPPFVDGDEAIASTRGALVSLQEVPKDLTYEDQEQHVFLLMGSETKQWRKCVLTLTTVLGTYTMIDHFFVIKTLDTNMTLGVHGLITLEKNTLNCEILQKVGEDEKEGQHQVIGNIHTHPFQEVYSQK